MCAVDIGANIGYYSMILASLVGETGTVWAFEPNSENCRLILLSKEENHFSQLLLHPLALTKEGGYVYFSPFIGSNGGLLPSVKDTLLNPNCTIVPCAALDTIIPDGQVDFIKADVEGAEYLTLKGAERILRRCRPVVTCEFSLEMINRVSGISGADFLRWMKSLGYSGRVLGNQGKAENIDDIDAFLATWGDYIRIEDILFTP
jgi:FkbM family methyltransferase